MSKTLYDMLYISTCGIHQTLPKQKRLESLDLEELYKVSCFHSLEALVGMTLKNAGVSLAKGWEDDISKAIRKNILFDAERTKILAFMENKGIWYMPLKGVILKEFYPAIGMRQMSDNDILFDREYADVMKSYMEDNGYEAKTVKVGNVDEYIKPPVYNFELHRALYGSGHGEWSVYYADVKERLIQNEGSEYGYHFTDEDFYVYILSHEYKHYSGGGTGLRSLLDVYIYLNEKEDNLDFSYIQKECEALGISEFEEQGRKLAKKVFSKDILETQENDICQLLSEKENEMLEYFLTSGVYGTTERDIKNKIGKFKKKTGSSSRFRYMWNRIFFDIEVYKDYYPFFYKHKWLVPVAWIYRIICMIFSKKRRNTVLKEVQVVAKKTKE